MIALDSSPPPVPMATVFLRPHRALCATSTTMVVPDGPRAGHRPTFTRQALDAQLKICVCRTRQSGPILFLSRSDFVPTHRIQRVRFRGDASRSQAGDCRHLSGLAGSPPVASCGRALLLLNSRGFSRVDFPLRGDGADPAHGLDLHEHSTLSPASCRRTPCTSCNPCFSISLAQITKPGCRSARWESSGQLPRPSTRLSKRSISPTTSKSAGLCGRLGSSHWFSEESALSYGS